MDCRAHIGREPMTVFPALERELREQSRWPMTYWMRPIAAGVALASVLLMAPNQIFQIRLGAEYFRQLHFIIFWAIWIFVPLMTADCISRERREGTLGLLFLTPLKPWEVVVAKALAHGLRAMGLCLAAIPLLSITMLLGGVSWQELLISVSILLESVMLALGAGLLASSFFRDRSHAVAASVLVAWLVVCAFGLIAYTALLIPALDWQYMRHITDGWSDYLGYGLRTLIGDGWGYWSDIITMYSRKGVPIWRPLLTMAACAAAMTGLLLAWTIFRVRSQWHEQPPSRLARWFKRFGLTPAYLMDYYRRWLRRGLERNPVGWLEQRQWSDRAAIWSWHAAAIGLAIGQFNDPRFLGDSSSMEIIKGLYWLQIAGLAAVAACSFVRERSNGVMELLLVTPLRERQIILGKLLALWRQVVPAAVVMLALWCCALPVWPLEFATIAPRLREGGLPLYCFAVMFLALPVMGLFYSLRYRSYVTAIVMTALMGLAIPWVFCNLSVDLMRHFSPLGQWNQVFRWWQYSYAVVVLEDPAMEFLLRNGGLPMVWQLAVGAVLWGRLNRRMVERNFSLTV